jgi:hypothetical protein
MNTWGKGEVWLLWGLFNKALNILTLRVRKS